MVIAMVGSVASVVVRYRRSRGVERQQLKWFLFATSLVPVALGLTTVLVLEQHSFIIALPLLGLSIALAVLRFGLYEIDVVISRTLVYGALASFITAVYVAIVVGIGTLIGSSERPNLALSILATAIVAVAFQPVRERLQKVANRLVYGKRATPYEVLSEFSERVGCKHPFYRGRDYAVGSRTPSQEANASTSRTNSSGCVQIRVWPAPLTTSSRALGIPSTSIRA